MTFSFPIEARSWINLSDHERSFFCFGEEYLPLPASHAEQIERLEQESAGLVWEHVVQLVPGNWPEGEPFFEEQALLSIHEKWNTDETVQEVRQWLHDRGVPYQTAVFLAYDQRVVVRVPWKLLVKYWDAFAWNVGYSMIAMEQNGQWACCFHHEDVIVFGRF